jgi:glycosyltransferase involved in cell wall biosynthesis
MDRPPVLRGRCHGRGVTGWRGLFSVVVLCSADRDRSLRAIESVCSQTFKDLEILAVGDRNSRRTVELAREIAKAANLEVRAVPADANAAGAMNLGAASAKGKYLAFLEGDDAFHAERLDVFARAMDDARPLVWGFSGVQAVDESDRTIDLDVVSRHPEYRAIRLSCSPLEAIRALGRENTVVTASNLIVEKDEYARVEGFRDFRFAYGWDLALRLSDRSVPFVAERPLCIHHLQVRKVVRGRTAGKVSEESARVVEDHRQRTSVRSLFVAPLASPLGDLLPDEAFAIKATLWTMTKLRAFAPAYGVARKTARFARQLRRRALGRRN